MENQARFIAKVANDLVDEGDSYTAQRLLMEVMPENVNNPVDKPYTIEIEIAHRRAYGHNTTILCGHTSGVFSATFSPDGKRIVSASVDGTIRIWSFPPLQDLIDQTRERFKDCPLTPEERRMYYLE